MLRCVRCPVDVTCPSSKNWMTSVSFFHGTALNHRVVGWSKIVGHSEVRQNIYNEGRKVVFWSQFSGAVIPRKSVMIIMPTFTEGHKSHKFAFYWFQCSVHKEERSHYMGRKKDHKDRNAIRQCPQCHRCCAISKNAIILGNAEQLLQMTPAMC